MAADRTSRHFGLGTYRTPAPGRAGTTVEIFQIRTRTVPPAVARVEAREGDRLDLLAYRATGNPDGAWQLADANAVFDPHELLEPGRLLAVPRPTGER